MIQLCRATGSTSAQRSLLSDVGLILADPVLYERLRAANIHVTDYHIFSLLASVTAAAKAEEAEDEPLQPQAMAHVRSSLASAQKKKSRNCTASKKSELVCVLLSTCASFANLTYCCSISRGHRRSDATTLKTGHKLKESSSLQALTTPARQQPATDPRTTHANVASTSRVPARPSLPKDSSIAINLDDDDEENKGKPLLPSSPSVARASPNPLLGRVAEEQQQQQPSSGKKPFKMPLGAKPFVPMASSSKGSKKAGGTRKEQSRSPSVVLMTPKRSSQPDTSAGEPVTESARKRRTRSFVPPPPPVTSLVGQSIMANPLGTPSKQANKKEKDESQELSLGDYERWLSRLKKEGD